MPVYEMTREIRVSETSERVEVYGLRCALAEEPDVSCDRAAVERLVADCNALELDPAHLHDVVCDFAADSRAAGRPPRGGE